MKLDRARAGGPLVEWLLRHGYLRGPFLFNDYWATVLRLHGVQREEREREGHVDPVLFRAALDRPDLDLPKFRYYLLLFLLGPVLLPFRAFRRVGRFPVRFRAARKAADAALEPHRLDLDPDEDGRVRVGRGGETLARDILDPRLAVGFASLFYASYKLPLASLTAILLMAVLAPLLAMGGWLHLVMDYWIPVGFPLLVLLIWVVFRDWVTAILGALPVVFARYLLDLLRPAEAVEWAPFFAAMAGLFLLYLLADWLFMPRPVPPVLYLYVADGPGRPYRRAEDGPGWLAGRAYWVWRYMILAPAELNKPWERDWERAELWIRADGPEAGVLEWVVTDAHYRELWIPPDRIGPRGRFARHHEAAVRHVREGRPGVWLVEMDAHVVFHTPWVRTVSFLPETKDVPVRSLRHVASGLFHGAARDDPEGSLAELEKLQLEVGTGVLGDIPEVVERRVERHIVSLPWRYWRYPLGAHRQQVPRLYGLEIEDPPPLIADPHLQVKAKGRVSRGDPHGVP